MGRSIYDADDPQTRHHPLSHYVRLLLKAVAVFILGIITLPLWKFYWLGRMIWHRPPNVVRLAQVRRYLWLTWTVQPPAPGLSALVRCWLTLAIIQQLLWSPLSGLAWFLDELLYGRALDQTEVVAPLLEISAGRSGSTQIARYLEVDPQLVAPSLLQSMFPYMWLWRLVPMVIGRFITQEQVRKKLIELLPPEAVERHEADPFRMDTFDAVLFTFHLNFMSLNIDPDVAATDFCFAVIAPHDRKLWEEDFVQLADRIIRKTLLISGTGPDGSPRRVFVKGHFLAAADALEKKYPDAAFLTAIREPAARLQSGINFLRVNPANPITGPVPWNWLASALARTETTYCEVEQEWFTRSSGARRCVIRFVDFVDDLEGTMKKVYRDCFDGQPVPPHVPRVHSPRERKNYTVNRSLADLGIDAAAYRAKLHSYIDWCCGPQAAHRKTDTVDHAPAGGSPND